jgi:hypothetical protein
LIYDLYKEVPAEKKMKDLVRIILLEENYDKLATLTDYISALENDFTNGVRTIVPLSEKIQAGFQLLTEDGSVMSETIYPGQLNIIILQFEEAVRRLEKNLPAILQFGEYGGEGGAHILITPENNMADLSVIFIQDSLVCSNLPIEDTIGDPADLWRSAENIRAELQATPANNGEYFKHVKLPLADLITSLESEASRGRKLFSVLDRQVDNTLYW